MGGEGSAGVLAFLLLPDLLGFSIVAHKRAWPVTGCSSGETKVTFPTSGRGLHRLLAREDRSAE